MKKSIILLTGILILSGCGTRFDTKTMMVPDYLLEDCNFPKPPDPHKYANMDFVQKEKALVNTYLKAAEYNHTCNTKLAAARAFQDKLRLIYGDKSSKKKVDDVHHTPSPESHTRLPEGK